MLKKTFQEKFNYSSNNSVFAPGRVNIIGEHTDYNSGFVFPVAIEYGISGEFSATNSNEVNIYSLDFNNSLSIDLNNLDYTQRNHDWSDYVMAVIWVLKTHDYKLSGFDLVISSNLPTGAGLSSSAAFELLIAQVFAKASNFEFEPVEMALLMQKAENEYIGVKCGIMDQMIIANAKANHAMLLDCADTSITHTKLDDNFVIAILDTGTRRELVDGEYNQRRSQCENVSAFFAVDVLRKVNLQELEQSKNQLSALEYKRAKHVISENQRVLDTINALEKQDLKTFGELIKQSHISLRDDFAVSTKYLDSIVEIANSYAGCIGARMTGAGFGGCAIAILEKNNVANFEKYILDNYKQHTGLDARVYITKATNGVSVR